MSAEGDSDDRAFVQLIIGKPGIYDATRLLDAFDLDICKCAIMTDRFIIQRPFHTFLFRTMLNPGHSCLIHDDRYWYNYHIYRSSIRKRYVASQLKNLYEWKYYISLHILHTHSQTPSSQLWFTSSRSTSNVKLRTKTLVYIYAAGEINLRWVWTVIICNNYNDKQITIIFK